MTSVQDIFKKCSPWMRLSICVNIHVKKALVNVLHNHINNPQVQPLPSDPADLYTFLQANRRKIQKSTFIKEHEKSILLPASGQTVDSSSFDISLTRFLIQTFCGIRNAKKDWKEPDTTDQTICAYVYRAASMRNSICHDNNIERLNATDFERKWKQLKDILQGLNYAEDIEPFKTETLDMKKYEHVILEEFFDHLRSYKDECSNAPTQDDHIRRRFHVDGNKSYIVNELELESLIKDNDSIVIYGEAGIGKTSTARRVKNEWHNRKILNDYHVIYYDSKRINKQITVESTAAPIYFSELGDYLRKNKRTIDDLSIYSCVKTTIDDLIILIDGIDEFPVRELVNENYVDELERKVMNNENITGAETIIAIYFGFLFPYSKALLLGRIGEFENLKKVKVQRNAAIFHRRTVNLELLQFDDVDIKDFTCLKICKQQSSRQTICIGACQLIFNEIKNIELCKIPTDLNSLIELCEKHPNENIGRITRTKLIIATILKRLNEHVNQNNYLPCETFEEINKHKNKFIDCIRTLGEISFNAVYKGDITIKVEKETINDIAYFKYKNLKIERKTLENLDLFYVRDFVYYFILEPHHTLNIEFLSACYLFSNSDQWDLILKLEKDRQLVIISFIAGLNADDYFTKDFVKFVLYESNYSIEKFINWLYDVEDVRKNLPNGGSGHNCWFGLMENQKLSPSLFLLDFISHDIKIPQIFIPKTIVCFCDGSLRYSIEWYEMKYLKHNLLTQCSDRLNIELFLKKFPSFRFIIKGEIEIDDDDEFNRLDQCSTNNLITFKINRLYLWASLDTYFNSLINLNVLHVGWGCDSCGSRSIDLILNALSSPTTNTTSFNIQNNIKCKQLRIDEISRFNSRQTEKLFTLGLSGVVDNIALRCSTFFTDEQITILKDVEYRNKNKLINIELYGVNFNCMFDLPNLGNRHISLNNVSTVTDDTLIDFRNHISSGYSNNLSNYKIIENNVPFVTKKNYSRDGEQSMYLNLWNVDFSKVSPEVFSNTFSLIPSFTCRDWNDFIPSSHWFSLTQAERCQINEIRIWKPLSKNFENFLNIKTNNIQFICENRNELKNLLNHTVNNQNIRLDKRINVFFVKVDMNDWNYYEQVPLFGEKTIEEYKNDFGLDNLQLDNIRIQFHEGEEYLQWWCCEISLPNQKSI